MGRTDRWPCCAVFGLAILATGCPVYVPAAEQVASPCQQASDCILGYRCVDAICVNGVTGPVDAASFDLLDRDGGGADSAQRDGNAVDARGRDQAGPDGLLRDRTGADQQVVDATGTDRARSDTHVTDVAATDQQRPDLVQTDTWVDLPPPPLAGLGAGTGHSRGTIDVSVSFPADTRDYARVYILRVAGAEPPDATCQVGVLAASYTSGHFYDGTFVDTGLVELAIYSYRACSYDVADQVTGGPVATAEAMGCWYVSGTESHNNLPAKIIDAWAGQWTVDHTDPPRRIFSGVTFASGDRITLSGASGRSVCRFEPNGTPSCVVDCPTGWKLFFKDGAGNLLWQAAPDDLGNYVGGVDIPAGAVSAWIGYRDGSCVTGSDCSSIGDPYMDNCDNRTASNGTCDKCNYDFTYGVFTCNAP